MFGFDLPEPPRGDCGDKGVRVVELRVKPDDPKVRGQSRRRKGAGAANGEAGVSGEAVDDDEVLYPFVVPREPGQAEAGQSNPDLVVPAPNPPAQGGGRVGRAAPGEGPKCSGPDLSVHSAVVHDLRHDRDRRWIVELARGLDRRDPGRDEALADGVGGIAGGLEVRACARQVDGRIGEREFAQVSRRAHTVVDRTPREGRDQGPAESCDPVVVALLGAVDEPDLDLGGLDTVEGGEQKIAWFVRVGFALGSAHGEIEELGGAVGDLGQVEGAGTRLSHQI